MIESVLFIGSKTIKVKLTSCNFHPFGVPRGTRGQNRPLVSFYDILKLPLIQRMRCTVIFRERVATFFLKKMSFLAELQSESFFLAVPFDFL